MRYKKILAVAVLIVAAMAVMSSRAFAVSAYTEGWNNSDLEGWIPNTDLTTVEIRDTGGNPNGYLYSYGNNNAGIPDPWLFP